MYSNQFPFLNWPVNDHHHFDDFCHRYRQSVVFLLNIAEINMYGSIICWCKLVTTTFRTHTFRCCWFFLTSSLFCCVSIYIYMLKMKMIINILPPPPTHTITLIIIHKRWEWRNTLTMQNTDTIKMFSSLTIRCSWCSHPLSLRL